MHAAEQPPRVAMLLRQATRAPAVLLILGIALSVVGVALDGRSD
jgi:hypothetical protein